MERTYIAENDAERARLEALVAGLSDADISRPIGHGWTVGVAPAHLAFWDRLQMAKLEEFERVGKITPFTGPGGWGDRVNDSMLVWWQNIAPAQVRYDVIAAANEVDKKLERLPDWLVEAVLAMRPRTLIRAVHRREHLGEIDRALASNH